MKTTNTLILLICSILISFISLAGGGSSGNVVPPPPGMPPCAVNPPPGATACQATPICNVHGFCGTTDGSYTADYWSNLNSAFCGSIENNAFLTFTAEASTISFDAYVYNCPSSDGIQVFIFDAANCGSGPVTSLVCVNHMYAQNTPYNITANGLTPGNQYYIMIDGFAGDVCDYTFVATEGVALPLGLDIGDEVTICLNETVTATAYGGDGTYTWDPSPHLNTTTGATVTITPPAVVGSYTYTTHSQGGIPNCPVTNNYTLTVHVEACCTIDNVISSSSCDLAASTYSVNGTIQVNNPPATGNLVVRDCNNNLQTIASAPFSLGSYPYTINNLNLNSPTCNIEAYFTGSDDCSHLLTYNAPVTTTPTFDPITLCQGDQAPNLPATSLNGIPGTWSPAAINTANAGTINHVFTPAAGYCSPTVTLGVVVNPSPDVNIAPPAILDCTTPGGITLEGSSSTPGASFQWSDLLGGMTGIVSGETTPTLTVESTGTYLLTVTEPATGCTSTATVDVVGNGDEPIVSIDPPVDLDCNNSLTTLVGNAVNSSGTQTDLVYEWSTTSGSFTSGVNGTSADIDGTGVYTFTVTDLTNGCVTAVAVEVEGNLDAPVIAPINAPVISCNDSTVILTGNIDPSVVNPTYEWTTTDGNITGQQDEHIMVDAAGTYVFTITNPDNHCSSSYTVTVTGNTNAPHADAGPDLAVCTDSTVILQGSSTTPGVTFSWTGTDGAITMTDFSNIPNPEVPYIATYVLTVTDPSNNCTASDTVEVVAHQDPVIFADTSVCDSYFQVPAGGITVSGPFTWSEQGGNGTFDDSTSITPVFTPSDLSVVNYVLVLTDACTSVSVNVSIIPQPTVHSPSNVCDVPKELISTSYQGGTWSGNGVTFNTSNTSANNDLTIVTTTASAAPGTYIVTYSYPQCNYTFNDTLVFPVPVSIFEDTVVCASSFQVPTGSVISSGSGQWTALPSGSGTFTPSGTSLHPTFTPNTGVVNITLIYEDACDSDTAVVTFPPQPVVSAPPAYSCNDMYETIYTTSYSGGSWTVVDNPATTWHEDTAIVFTPGNTVPPGSIQDPIYVSSHPTAGVYTLTFTENTCGYSETITLNFLPYPWTEINDTTLCAGVEYQLSAWEGPYDLNYEWNTGATGASIIVTQPGIYYVEAFNDCYSYTDSATINYETCDIDAPNVISLSSQSGNNIWYVNSYGITGYNCIIVNRWGNLIYEYNDINGHWDGRDMSGNTVTEGVYFYTIEATYESGEEVKKHGFIHVVH